MSTNTIHLRSPFPPTECARRLAAVIDPEGSGRSLWSGPCTAAAKPVVGSVEGTSLRLRKRLSYRNSFQTHLRAELRPAGAGTELIGRMGALLFARLFTAVWLTFVGLNSLPFVLALVSSLASRAAPSFGKNDWVPPVMLVFGIGFFTYGRFLAREESKYLTDFLARTLKAEVVFPA